jgi:flagellar biosynthesis protein FlhB
MEKSIESIWKEGFLKSDALIAPKLNDLYNQKSTHIVDKYKRMLKINLWGIVIGSFIVLIASFIVGIPVMGIMFFLIVNTIVIVNRKLLPRLEKIDKNVSSYQYIKSFDSWLKEQLSLNRRMARYYYPLFFLSIVLGFWFSNNFQELYQQIISSPNQIYFVNEIPVFWVLGIIFITGLLAFFGGRLYNWDVSLIYGRVFKKLEELIADMEELRS